MEVCVEKIGQILQKVEFVWVFHPLYFKKVPPPFNYTVFKLGSFLLHQKKYLKQNLKNKPRIHLLSEFCFTILVWGVEISTKQLEVEVKFEIWEVYIASILGE